MKRKQYRCKSVMCPYYKKEDRQTIYCSGVIDNSSVHLAFGHDTDCKQYKDIICKQDYRSCRVFDMLEGMYNG